MAGEGFWNSPGRFAILGEAEFLDRIESATRSAIQTVERLASQPAGGPAIRSLVSKMALRIHLLENAWHDAGEGKSSATWIALQPLDDTPKCAAFATALAGHFDLMNGA
jgi:hydroxypyruvate isomerase